MSKPLDKLKNLRRRRRQAHSAEPKRPPRQISRRWFWIWMAISFVSAAGGYFWATSARIIKGPVAVAYSPLSPAFPDALGPLLGAEFSRGNTVEMLVNGAQFFPAMLKAIAGAQHTITLETYIWAPGRISDEFIAALSERARHGVKVLVIMDGMGTLKFRHEDRVRLQEAGVQLFLYGREHWYEIKPNISHRTHRKLLVVDGRVGFTGGMCIDDRWMGDANSAKVWRDTEVRVEGPVVREMQSVFAANWLKTTSSVILGPDFFPQEPAGGTSLAQCIKSGPGEGLENVRMSYLTAIAAARKSIDIANAYFVPDDLAVDMLAAAARRGVRVRVMVPAINDSRIGRAVSRSRWGTLLAAGVEIYQYLPAMFHCKTMVVDDAYVTVGSANFDNRSFRINDEDCLNVIDPAVAGAALRIFADDLKQSRRMTLEEFRGRSVFVKVADHFFGLFRSQF